MQTITGWIRDHIHTQGRDWVAANMHRCAAELDQEISPTSFSRRLREVCAELRGDPKPESKRVIEMHEVVTYEELLAFHDLDETEWEVPRFRINFWGNADNPNHQIRADVVRRPLPPPEVLAQDFLDAVKNYSPVALSLPEAPHVDRPAILEVSVPDLHLGQLSWSRESGSDYDVRIAADLFKEAIKQILSRAAVCGPYEEIWLVIGGDFFNVDTDNGTTTSGTPQHEDGRWPKTYAIGAELCRWAVDEALRYGVKVRVIKVQGNHDFRTGWFLGEWLRAWYRNEQRVVIHNEPNTRSAFLYGNTMILYQHKPERNIKDVVNEMATGWPDKWAASKYRECHAEHLHHFYGDEEKGTRMVGLPSLVARDDYHARGGWRSLREAQARRYCKEEGMTNLFTWRPV